MCNHLCANGNNTELSGELVITNDWFNDNVYEVIIDKKYLSNKLHDIYNNQKPISLLPWEVYI